MRRHAAHIMMLLSMILTGVMTGCDHKEIADPSTDEREIKVLFNWDRYPGASPKGMTLYFFPLDSRSRIWRFDIAGRDGGTVSLPDGNYSLVAYNNDLPAVTMSEQTSADAVTASLRVINGVADSSGDLYCAMVDKISITPCGVEYTRDSGGCKECPFGLVRALPERRFCNYTVVVRHVEGIGYARRVAVLLDDVASGVRIASDQMCEPGVSLAVDMEILEAENRLEGKSTAFGVLPGRQKFMARLQVVRTDGVALAKEYDVTSQVAGAADPRDVTIVIDSVEIPPPGSPTPPGGDGDDVGIVVGVDGWHVIKIDITT